MVEYQFVEVALRRSGEWAEVLHSYLDRYCREEDDEQGEIYLSFLVCIFRRGRLVVLVVLAFFGGQWLFVGVGRRILWKHKLLIILSRQLF